MHSEFAVEPELMAVWSHPKEFRYFWDAFGPDAGRFVARFPDDWKECVKPHLSRLSELDRIRAVEIAKRISSLLVDRPCQRWSEEEEWISNAIAEDKRQPFRAIIASTNPAGSRRVLTDDWHPEDGRWKVDRGAVVPREARAIAQCAGGLLRVSRELYFVDPYFEPQAPDRVAVLCALLGIVEPRAADLTVCQFHTRADRRLKEEFRQDCEEALLSVLPGSIELEILRWDRLPRGERAHARYILTERGGIAIDYGLSEERGSTTDIRILEDEIWTRRLRDVREGTALRFADGFRITKAI